MTAFIRFVTERAGLTLLIVVALTVVAILQIVGYADGRVVVHLEVDPSVSRLVPEEGEDRQLYERARRIFGSDETVVVALVADDVFTAPVLSAVQRMTQRLEELEYVHHVVSLSNALNIRAADDDLLIEPFLVEVPESPEGFADLRRQALGNPIYAGNLVSSSANATALVVYLVDMPEREFISRGIGEQIQRVTEEERGEAEVWITGPPMLNAAASRILLSDLALIVPFAFGLASLVAFLSFRTLRGVLIPAGTIVVGLIWTFGVMAGTGRTLNLVTNILPPLLLTVGFAYSIHILADYYAVLRAHRGDEPPGPKETVAHALRDIMVPVVLTGITTSAGFLALTVSPIAPVREFGIFATVGVIATVISALTFAPAVLASLKVPRRVAELREGWIDRAAEAAARFDLRYRREVLLGGALIALVSIWGVSRIELNNPGVSNLMPDEPARIHFEAINEHLEGSNPFFVVLEANYRDAFTEPSNLEIITELQRWLASQPEVGGTTSLADYLMLINRGFHDDDPAYLAIPESQALAKQLLFFGANDEIDSFVDSRYQTTSILVRAKINDTGPFAEFLDRVEDRLAALPDRLKGSVTGNTVLVARAIDDIAGGQAQSLLIAFAAIYVILALLFTSLRIGLAALLPNALPVLIYYGMLGLTGVTLNAVTGLVGCIVLGIAVDDTIHYLTRFNAESRRLGNERDGTIAALRGVARPVTWTTVGLCVGFATLTFSNLQTQIHFGALGAFVLAVAWATDVTFTPALCSGVRIVGLWDLLTLDLGPDPQKQVPLFAGLSRARARMVALLTDLRTLAKGEMLMRTGDSGRDMFVVLDGELEASIRTEDGGKRVLSVLRRGDTVGEVALFHGKRTADVEALSEVRVMRIEEQDLARIKRRHPRTAAQLLTNLSRILAETVARSTEKLR